MSSQIQTLLGVTKVDNHDRYLGLPTITGKLKHRIFFFLVKDIVLQKLKSSKEKSLSTGGKEVFIKAIIQSIPTYVMGCFLLLKSLYREIESLINRVFDKQLLTGPKRKRAKGPLG